MVIHLGELMAIGRVMLDRASYYLSGEAETAFGDYLTLRMARPRFANARVGPDPGSGP